MVAAQPSEPGVRLAEVIIALALATDLGMGLPLELTLRSAVLTVRLGEELGLSDEELYSAYYLALLRLVGCTSDAHGMATVFGDERATRQWLSKIDYSGPPSVIGAMLRHHGAGEPWPRRGHMLATAFVHLPKLSESTDSHCEVAQRLSTRLGFEPAFTRLLWQAFERWDGRGMPNGLKGEEIARPMRVMQVAQEAMIFCMTDGPDAALTMVRQRAGSSYDPKIAELFCRKVDKLFASGDEGSDWEAALKAEPGSRPVLSSEQLDTAAEALGDFTDLQAPCMAGHSRGVAELAADAARRSGLSLSETVFIRRAALLHDLGRVSVSAGIWMKPGPLSEGEWERVRLHPYYTERVLARPPALGQIGALAALHHERLDGSGYHRGLTSPMLPPTARLLAAADVYQAMTEPRPYRPARPPDAAADELLREARAGRLDGEAVNAVLAAAGHRVSTVRRERVAGLSEREVEVLRLLAQGLSNREMAERLSISKDTVGHHIRHIYDKINVSTRACATLFAMQHGLLGDLVELPVTD